MPYCHSQIWSIYLGRFLFLTVTFPTCRYKPLFDFFLELQETAFRVIADNYVTDDSGTGVVHCAPAFGEDDHRVCLAAGIIEVGKILLYCLGI
jgi:isoleucyl-tRNA synthetase